ncbi:MAG: transcription antitermination factor NusB [Candidatus Latescibacterota bacterium]|nr:MAG: transcription antitermination factor NusB [Candidatus Latescibacterota bacterium]
MTLGKRRKAREIVLQALYESEFSDQPWEAILDSQTSRRESTPETVEYARLLLSKTVETAADLDEKIRSVVENWEMERISLIDKNILRFALCEILYFPDVPSKVIVNEAIEIAHKYSSHEAGKFVNGILDRLLRLYRQDSN